MEDITQHDASRASRPAVEQLTQRTFGREVPKVETPGIERPPVARTADATGRTFGKKPQAEVAGRRTFGQSTTLVQAQRPPGAFSRTATANLTERAVSHEVKSKPHAKRSVSFGSTSARSGAGVDSFFLPTLIELKEAVSTTSFGSTSARPDSEPRAFGGPRANGKLDADAEAKAAAFTAKFEAAAEVAQGGFFQRTLLGTVSVVTTGFTAVATALKMEEPLDVARATMKDNPMVAIEGVKAVVEIEGNFYVNVRQTDATFDLQGFASMDQLRNSAIRSEVQFQMSEVKHHTARFQDSITQIKALPSDAQISARLQKEIKTPGYTANAPTYHGLLNAARKDQDAIAKLETEFPSLKEAASLNARPTDVQRQRSIADLEARMDALPKTLEQIVALAVVVTVQIGDVLVTSGRTQIKLDAPKGAVIPDGMTYQGRSIVGLTGAYINRDEKLVSVKLEYPMTDEWKQELRDKFSQSGFHAFYCDKNEKGAIQALLLGKIALEKAAHGLVPVKAPVAAVVSARSLVLTPVVSARDARVSESVVSEGVERPSLGDSRERTFGRNTQTAPELTVADEGDFQAMVKLGRESAACERRDALTRPGEARMPLNSRVVEEMSSGKPPMYAAPAPTRAFGRGASVAKPPVAVETTRTFGRETTEAQPPVAVKTARTFGRSKADA